MEELLQKLKEKFSDFIISQSEFRGMWTIEVVKKGLVDILSYLKDLGFNSLVDLCGVDMGVKENPRFWVVYHLRNMDTLWMLRVKVPLEGDILNIPSVVSLWEGASWMERETYDMYGIHFEGHPHLTRLYLPEDFEGHPLRKDFPTEGYKD